VRNVNAPTGIGHELSVGSVAVVVAVGSGGKLRVVKILIKLGLLGVLNASKALVRRVLLQEFKGWMMSPPVVDLDIPKGAKGANDIVVGVVGQVGRQRNDIMQRWYGPNLRHQCDFRVQETDKNSSY
jgi:hypothetical protein